MSTLTLTSTQAFRSFAAAALLLTSLAGCSTPEEPHHYADLTFTAQPAIRLNVANIDVTQTYAPTNADPHVDHLFPEPPAKAALQWAHDRLQAAGADGKASYEIVDASVIDTKLPRSSGITAMTSVDQTDRFDLTLTVRLSAASGDNLHHGSAQVTVTRSQTINEKTTENQKTDLWYDMTKQALAELDAKLGGQIDGNLGWFRQTAN